MHTRHWVGAATAAIAFAGAPTAAHAADVLYGVTAENRLTSLSSDAPGAVATPQPITGLDDGEQVLGIDVRPATGGLYALGATGAVYTIDPVTARATRQFVLAGALDAGADYGVDFNPTVDKLRLVSDQGDNRRINPDTGAEIGPDGDLSTPGVTAAAYTNNVNGRQAGATTQLFTIDVAQDRLNLQDPPNAGTQSPVGALGVDATDASFDVPAAQNVGYAALTVGGTQSLYSVDLTTGAATAVGEIGGLAPLVGLAAARQEVPLYGLTAPDAGAQRLLTLASSAPRNTDAAQAVPVLANRAVSGLPAGVTLTGVDTRPADGLVYGFGTDGRVYRVDVESGRATQTASPAAPITPGASTFGVDFNPVPNRLRVVDDAEDNFRIDPDGAGPVTVDGAITPASGLAGAAYRDSFAGATATRLYTIDADANTVNVQDPPNDGVQTAPTALGPNGAPFDVDGEVGYDLAAQDNLGYLAARVNGATRSTLYRLESGVAPGTSPLTGATPIGQVGADPAAGFTLRGLTAATAGELGFVAPDATVSEGAGGVQLAVGRTVAYGYATVDYAVAGPDGTVTGALTFAPGERLRSVDFPLSDDEEVTEPAQIAVTLSRGAGGYRLGTTQSVVTVLDDDAAEAPPAQTVTQTTPAPPPVTTTTPGATVTTPGATVTAPATPAAPLPGATVTIPGTTVVVPAPAPGLQPDRGRPVVLAYAPDRRLRTLRASGVPIVVSTNEAARIDLAVRLGDRVVGTATTVATGPTVARTQLRSTAAGRRALGTTRTRRLAVRVTATDVAGNVTTQATTFRATVPRRR